MECCLDGCPSSRFPHLCMDFRSSVRVTIGFLITSLTKALLAPLARQPTLGRVLVVQNLFHFTIIEVTVLLQTLKTFLEMFLTLTLKNFIADVYRLGLHGLVFVLTCSVKCGTLYT